jgi:hypothetical protein
MGSELVSTGRITGLEAAVGEPCRRIQQFNAVCLGGGRFRTLSIVCQLRPLKPDQRPGRQVYLISGHRDPIHYCVFPMAENPDRSFSSIFSGDWGVIARQSWSVSMSCLRFLFLSGLALSLPDDQLGVACSTVSRRSTCALLH